MSVKSKPIFVATHPRACSTAFERIFMTRRDILTCVHEPFSDAFYFGPERLSARYEDDETARKQSGFANSTFKFVLERIEQDGKEGKRLFIKDIAHYLVPPNGRTATIAPSLGEKAAKKVVGTDIATHPTGASNGHPNDSFCSHDKISEPGNPTVIPAEVLKQFHFTFLIRHPGYSIPSYYRCTIPSLNSVTGFGGFDPSEAGYDELRRIFDFLVKEKQIGPSVAGKHAARELADGEVNITVVDADDLLENPEGIVEAYCREVGIDYDSSMLNWNAEMDHQRARDAFAKWKGFHEDAINSSSLRPRSVAHKTKAKMSDNQDSEWREKYGEDGARIIRNCVDANISDYEYLKSFALTV